MATDENPYRTPAIDAAGEAGDSNPPKRTLFRLSLSGLFCGVFFGSLAGTLSLIFIGVFSELLAWANQSEAAGDFNHSVAVLFGMATYGGMLGACLGGPCGLAIAWLVRAAGPVRKFWSDYLGQTFTAGLTLLTLGILYSPESPASVPLFLVGIFTAIATSFIFGEFVQALLRREIW